MPCVRKTGCSSVGPGKGERTASRLGYRSGYYSRTLITGVGKLELEGAAGP